MDETDALRAEVETLRGIVAALNVSLAHAHSWADTFERGERIARQLLAEETERARRLAREVVELRALPILARWESE